MVEALDDAARRLLLGRVAGVLFLTGALASLPVNRILDAAGPRPAALSALGIASGLVCLALPWRRLHPRTLHLLCVLAVAEVGLTMWAIGGAHAGVYSWFAVLVVVFVAWAFDDRRVVAAHTAWALTVLVVPVVLDGGSYAVGQLVVAVPVLVVAGGVVVHLREGLQRGQRALAEQALIDPLTGAHNRRLLDVRLPYEVARHARNDRSLALLFFDLNGFKEVNDRLSHTAGDGVLRDVSARLAAAVRADDTVVRLGGDEFCVLAPETGRDEAERLADRVRATLAEVRPLGEPLTAAVGFAVFPDDAVGASDLLACADLDERRDKSAAREVPVPPALA